MSNEQLIALLAARVAERLEIKLDEISHRRPKIHQRLYSVRDASTFLGITERATRHLVERKVLPAIKVGRRVYLDRVALEKWIQNRNR